jgi:MSHA biogenesis protein MshO
MMKRQAGFTLLELIMVVAIVGVMASILVVAFKPAFDSYVAVAHRAGLTDQTDTAMRKMTRDIRLAVPNSIRLATPQCVEFIPTSTGGRYRTKPDTVWDAVQPGNPSKPIDTNSTVSEFDVLTALTAIPVAGDWVVIDNQNTNDVYSGTNRASILSVGTPPIASPSLGFHRITLNTATQFPVGYDGGRFNIVPNGQQAVFYVCASPGIDANGDGTGKVYRFANYGFNAASPISCPVPNATTPVLVNHVESCSFVYASNHGATQQSGFVEIQLKFTQKSESVALLYGTHVDNVP